MTRWYAVFWTSCRSVQIKMIRSITNRDREKILDLLRQAAVFNEREISIAIEIADLVHQQQEQPH